MHEKAHCRDKATNHQFPIAVAFWIIPVVFSEECLTLMQNFMQIHYCSCSIILTTTTTQYTRSLSGVYHPQWLVQWSHHCSLMLFSVYSSWLPGYINVMQTVLIILTIAGLFPEKPCMLTVRRIWEPLATTKQLLVDRETLALF